MSDQKIPEGPFRSLTGCLRHETAERLARAVRNIDEAWRTARTVVTVPALQAYGVARDALNAAWSQAIGEVCEADRIGRKLARDAEGRAAEAERWCDRATNAEERLAEAEVARAEAEQEADEARSALREQNLAAREASIKQRELDALAEDERELDSADFGLSELRVAIDNLAQQVAKLAQQVGRSDDDDEGEAPALTGEQFLAFIAGLKVAGIQAAPKPKRETETARGERIARDNGYNATFDALENLRAREAAARAARMDHEGNRSEPSPVAESSGEEAPQASTDGRDRGPARS